MKRAAVILIYWTILIILRLSPLPGRTGTGRDRTTAPRV
jgi:hypothetical protein